VGEGDLVGVLEIDADGDAASEAGDLEVGVGVSELALEEDGGGFALDAGICGDDDLGDLIRGDAGD